MGNKEAGNRGVTREQKGIGKSVNGIVQDTRMTEGGRLEVVLKGVEKPIILELGGNEAGRSGEANGQD